MNTASEYEIKAYRQTISEFSKKEIRPGVLESDGFPFVDFNTRIINKLSNNEFLCPTLPKSAGGPEAGLRLLGTLLQEVAKEDASIALTIFIQSLAATLLVNASNTELINNWLDDFGTTPGLLALPIYEDPSNFPDAMQAEATENGFILNGSMNYVPCLPVAKALIIPATMSLDQTIRFFILSCDTSGVLISEPIVSLGLRGCPVADLKLQEVFLSNDSVIFAENDATKYETVCDRFRGPLTAISLGILKGAYATASSYAKDRYQGKKQIIEHHMIRMMLSNMISWIDTASVAVDVACRFADQNQPYPPSALLSIQHLVTTAVTQATTDGVQILGGYGYMHEYGQEKRMRDAKQIQAVFGSTPAKKMEIVQRNV